MSSKKSNHSQQGTGAATRHIAGSLRPHSVKKYCGAFRSFSVSLAHVPGSYWPLV